MYRVLCQSQSSATSGNLQVCNLKSYIEKRKKLLGVSVCGGCFSGRGRVVRCNISVWRIRVVWGEIRHRRITALLNASARASEGAAAMQRLCQTFLRINTSWRLPPPSLTPACQSWREHLIRRAHCSLSLLLNHLQIHHFFICPKIHIHFIVTSNTQQLIIPLHLVSYY